MEDIKKEDNFSFKGKSHEELLAMRFFVPMNCFDVYLPGLGFGLKSGRREDCIPIECRFTERRRSLDICDDCYWPYKVELEPVDEQLRELFGHEEYYGCDFESMVNQDYIHLKKSPTEHVEQVTWEEPLCGRTVIRHEGWTIKD